jgi:hypothetical protein
VRHPAAIQVSVAVLSPQVQEASVDSNHQVQAALAVSSRQEAAKAGSRVFQAVFRVCPAEETHHSLGHQAAATFPSRSQAVAVLEARHSEALRLPVDTLLPRRAVLLQVVRLRVVRRRVVLSKGSC